MTRRNRTAAGATSNHGGELKGGAVRPEEHMTVARMEQILTPQRAARVLAQTAMFRLAVHRDDYTDQLDKQLAEDGHHLAFVYALHAVARRA
jgi:hypothetical protein